MTDFSGFDQFVDDLDDVADKFGEMADNAEQLGGESDVSFGDLFTEQFMQEHTDTTSFGDFINNSQWTVESEQDFEAIPEGEFDEYVRDHSDFNSWENMSGAAGTEWVAREIGLR